MEQEKKGVVLTQKDNVEDLLRVEIAGSERLRANILILLLGVEALILIVIFFFYRKQYLTLFNTNLAIYAVLIFALIIIIHEYLLNQVISRGVRFFSNNHNLIIFLNAFFEITLLTLLFVFIIEFSDQTVILQAPATQTYYLFIVLSTLRLNFKLSVFTGALAALEFVLVSIYYSTTWKESVSHATHPDLTGMQYLGQGLIMLISGIAAGFVADLIKRKVWVSWKHNKERIEVIDLFGQQISTKVAESILEKKNELSGIRKNVCVMFLDIRNFTPFVEQHSPEEVVSYLNSLFHFMIDSVQRYDGVINQFLGDGFMATFGAPVSEGNYTQKSVLAAIEIVDRLKIEIDVGRVPETKIGIGLHCGEAVIGNIGSAVRKQYSITGNVVVIASRIEQLNKQWQSQLILSEEVYGKLDTNLKDLFLPMEPQKFKGLSLPVIPYVLNKP